MRTDVMRWVLVVFTTFAVGGCYSNGQWSAPNLAFWKSSPFQSSTTADATPGAPGSPVKPSGIAANSTSADLGIRRVGGATTTPPTTSLGSASLPTGYPTSYPTSQYPSTSTSTTPNSASSPAGMGYGSTPYTANTAAARRPRLRLAAGLQQHRWTVRQSVHDARLRQRQHESLCEPVRRCESVWRLVYAFVWLTKQFPVRIVQPRFQQFIAAGQSARPIPLPRTPFVRPVPTRPPTQAATGRRRRIAPAARATAAMAPPARRAPTAAAPARPAMGIIPTRAPSRLRCRQQWLWKSRQRRPNRLWDQPGRLRQSAKRSDHSEQRSELWQRRRKRLPRPATARTPIDMVRRRPVPPRLMALPAARQARRRTSPAHAIRTRRQVLPVRREPLRWRRPAIATGRPAAVPPHRPPPLSDDRRAALRPGPIRRRRTVRQILRSSGYSAPAATGSTPYPPATGAAPTSPAIRLPRPSGASGRQHKRSVRVSTGQHQQLHAPPAAGSLAGTPCPADSGVTPASYVEPAKSSGN